MRVQPAGSVSGRFVLALAVLFLLFVPGAVNSGAHQATPAASPVVSTSALPPAWLEFGPGGQVYARAIALDECPPLLIDGKEMPTTVRAPESDDFPVLGCEATIPFGVLEAHIGGQALPLPSGPFNRIAVIGDTGCRLNAWEKKYQACNDPNAWPFARVAESVAAWNPDLIIHVGDYLYRESPCPVNGGVDCAGSPHGDTWATWNADFFAPATPLLGAAPWIFMRGNHETCGRNPEGWFRFLDPRAYEAECPTFTEPYVAPLNGFTFAAIDSAEAADENDTPQEAAEYTRQFDLLAEITPSGAWLITHRPIWGILEGKEGEFQVENAAFEAASKGSLKADFGLVLSGHIHLTEALSFEASSARSPQLIVGNSGTALDDIPTASPAAGQLGDPAVEDAETLAAFGFLTLEPHGERWLATQRDANGKPLRTCDLALPEIVCGDPSS